MVTHLVPGDCFKEHQHNIDFRKFIECGKRFKISSSLSVLFTDVERMNDLHIRKTDHSLGRFKLMSVLLFCLFFIILICRLRQIASEHGRSCCHYLVLLVQTSLVRMKNKKFINWKHDPSTNTRVQIYRKVESSVNAYRISLDLFYRF